VKTRSTDFTSRPANPPLESDDRYGSLGCTHRCLRASARESEQLADLGRFSQLLEEIKHFCGCRQEKVAKSVQCEEKIEEEAIREVASSFATRHGSLRQMVLFFWAEGRSSIAVVNNYQLGCPACQTSTVPLSSLTASISRRLRSLQKMAIHWEKRTSAYQRRFTRVCGTLARVTGKHS
jgi:hypothetical protein